MKSVFLTYIFEQIQMRRYAKRTIEFYLYCIQAISSYLQVYKKNKELLQNIWMKVK
jgi:hypothetical protein